MLHLKLGLQLGIRTASCRYRQLPSYITANSHSFFLEINLVSWRS